MPTSVHINTIATTTGVHNHDYEQLMIGLAGRMDCELPGFSRPLLRGSLGLLPCSTLHRYAGKDVDCRVLVLDYRLDDPFVSALLEVCGTEAASALQCEAELLRPSPALIRHLAWYETSGRLDKLQSPTVQSQVISGLLTEIMISKHSQSQDILSRSRVDASALQSWVDARLDGQISIAAMADAFHTSESHLYVAVKKLLGCSPAQFITHRRMNKAIELLRRKTVAIGSIATEVGYADAPSFSKAFRRHFGVSPRSTR